MHGRRLRSVRWSLTLLRVRCLHLLFLLMLGGCSLGERFLRPDGTWLGEPSALGLAYEDVVLPTGRDTTVHGWFLPSAVSDGRTVVLCHGSAANISFYHPYYRFLHASGFHVFLFDYRGYGKSRGELSVGALTTDTEAALQHVFARPEVDRSKVSVFGISLGAIVALHAAAGHPELAGLVIENASSPHAAVRRAAGWFLTFWAELFALPGGLEPVDNAGRYRGPALFLCGAWDWQLLEHLDAAAAHVGPTASWVMPDTGHSPAGLLQHDGEYERRITEFLHACADGRAPRLEATVVQVEGGEATVTIGRHDLGNGPLAVELAVVATDGQVALERFWLLGDEATIDVPAAAAPAYVAASAYSRVAGDPGATAWQPVRGPLRLAADALPVLRALATMAAGAAGDPLAHARSFATTLSRHEVQHGPLAPLAMAELVPELVATARLLAASNEPEDLELARTLLQRAVAAEPRDHRLHYWPASPYVAGFAHGARLDEARDLLATLTKAR